MSPLRSRKSSARFSYEDIENALRDVENVTSRSETENQESNDNHRSQSQVDYDKTEVDSTEEEGTTSSTSVEPVGRYTSNKNYNFLANAEVFSLIFANSKKFSYT